jgi:DNA-binding Xre family transcriptional regulator
MKKKNDPPDYPGDEAVNKAFGDALREIRLAKGLPLEEVDALLQKAEREGPHPHVYRALGIVVRQLRETQKMSRVQLSEVSGLRIQFISRLERGKASDVTVVQIVRLAMALEQPVTDFVEQVVNKEKELSSR